MSKNPEDNCIHGRDSATPCPHCLGLNKNPEDKWIEEIMDGLEKTKFPDNFLPSQLNLVYHALHTAYTQGREVGQVEGAKGKFFSSVEIVEPLPKHLYEKIYNQGKADALKEVGERVGYILNARLADFNVSRGEIKTLTDLKNYLKEKE